MIYTLTPNPAIDLYVGLDQLKPEIVNRTYEEGKFIIFVNNLKEI